MNRLDTAFVFLLICFASKTAHAAPRDAGTAPGSKTCGCSEIELDANKYWLDIIYILDSSWGVSANDFRAVKEFLSLMRFANIDQIPGVPQYTRIGIINTAASAVRVANLTTLRNKQQLLEMARAIPQLGGSTFDAQAGLRAAADMITDEQVAHRRNNVRKVIVMFSTASFDCKGKQSRTMSTNETHVLCALVSVLQDDGVILVTVGIRFAGESDFPYIDIGDKCNSLDNTENMTLSLLTVLCRANCYCLEPYTQFAIGEDGCDKYGECVYVHNMALSITGARETCQKEGSFITSVPNIAKNEFLIELHLGAGFFPFWLGMACTSSGCTHDDGTQMGPTDYTNWCGTKTQPDYGRGKCAYENRCTGFDTAWFSERCGNLIPSHFFSCQTDSCSVNKYCDYANTAQISKRKVQMKKRS